MGTKLIGIVVAVLVIAGGVYYVLSGQPTAETALDDLKAMTDSLATDGTQGDTGAAQDVPAATDSVDDFEAALNADLDASLSAIDTLDTDVDASVDAVVNSGNDVYDPNNI